MLKLFLIGLAFGFCFTANLTAVESYQDVANQVKSSFNRKGLKKLYASYKVTDTSSFFYTFGSTYDQALIAIHFIKSRDFTTAQEILNFFQDQFYNRVTPRAIYVSYNIDDGTQVEFESGSPIVRLGEMLWVGLASCHYENLSGDTRYRQFIKDLADRISSFQQNNGRFLGGYAGSTSYSWASTEHNMDARSFYLMVYYLTGNNQYLTISDNVKNWLLNSAYNSSLNRFNRGHNGTSDDTAFATDTHSWGLLALDDVLSDSQKNNLFSYPVTYAKASYGFDFTDNLLSRNSDNTNASAPAISYEWTLQMAGAYKWLGYYSQAETILQSIGSVLTSNKGIPYADRSILTFARSIGGWEATTYHSMASLMWYAFAKARFNPFLLTDSVSFNLDSNATVTNKFLSDRTIQQTFLSTSAVQVTYENGVSFALVPGVQTKVIAGTDGIQWISTQTAVISNAGFTVQLTSGTLSVRNAGTGINVELSTDTLQDVQTIIPTSTDRTLNVILRPSSGRIKIAIPPGTLSENVQARIRLPDSFPSSPPDPLFSALGTGIQIVLNKLLQPSKSVPITMEYTNLNLGGKDPDTLVIGRYDDTLQQWIILSSSVDKLSRTVTASTNHFSTFQLIALSPAADVQQAKAYPNPLKMHAGKTLMTFANLSAYSNVRIYTYLGELVRQLSADVSGLARWDAKNSYGQTAASGVYLVVIEGANSTRKVLKVIIEK